MPRIQTLLQGSSLNTSQGGIAFCAVNLIEGPDASGGLRRVVVDTGSAGRVQALAQELSRRGLTGSDIDAVVLTHAHWDHMQNLDLFSRAAFFLHPAELDYIADPHPHDHATPRWTRAVLDRYDIRTVVEGSELMSGVEVLAVPGHSAGTIALKVSTADGTAVITGDSVQSGLVAQRRRNPLVFWDVEQADRAIGRVIGLAEVIYPGHDRAFRMSTAGALEYLQEFELTVTGPTGELAGMSLQPDPGFKPQAYLP